LARRFGVSQPVRRAYGPAREEDECGMVMDAGLDNAGSETGERDSAGRDSATLGGTSFSGATPRDRTASDMPDPRKLAQDWITLWQSELSAMAADPEIRESWQTVMALWAGTVSNLLRGLPRDQGYDGAGGRSGPADAPRAPPTAAALDARDAEIDRLARHVADLEHRLAELTQRIERGSDPAVHPRRRPATGPGRKPHQ
jgi:hypothetical protein